MRARLAGLIFTTFVGQAGAADIAGSARALDGDTLFIAGRQICLHGVDAPEPSQLCERKGRAWPCGQAATEALAGLVAGQPVACHAWSGVDGRLVARCRVGWRDLGAEMVSRGLAIAVEGESMDYVQNHREARARGLGIFAGTFVAPPDWRRGKRRPIEPGD